MLQLKVFLLLAVIICSCSKKNANIEKSNFLDSDNISQIQRFQDNSAEQIPADSKLLIEFERGKGDCWGGCPVYTLSIYSDGTIIFEGKENVKHLGSSESKLPESKIKELTDGFKDVDFFKLSDRYLPQVNCPQLGADYQTARIFYKKDSLTKKITHYQGCSGSDELKKLVALENKIDKIANTKRWIK